MTVASRGAGARAHAELGSDARPVSRPPTRFERAAYVFVRALVAGFARLFWRLEVRGRERVPRAGAFILSPVHRSNIDTPLAACVTPRRMRFLGKDSMWKFGWSAWFFTTLGGFPVHRGAPDREALRNCELALRRGEPVVVFPEGTRRSGEVVEEIFEGAAFLAVRTGVPIVPVGIGGSEAAMPKGAKVLHPVKIRMIVGQPISPPERQEGGRGSRRQVHELTEQLHVELQRLFDEARAGL